MASEAGRPGAVSTTLRFARCGASFHRGISDASGRWCARLPPLPREAHADAAGCLCESCLREAPAAPPRAAAPA